MGCSSSASFAASPVESIPTTSSVVSTASPTEFHSNYQLGAKIGKGSYGEVYVAHNRIQRGVRVALKVRTLSSEQSKDSLDHKVCKSACAEVCFWNHVGTHPNCVRMHASFFDDHLCYMVMELCSRSLIEYIKDLSVFCVINERSLATVFTQMLQGISHIHSVNVSHRDLKPDNFLIGRDGRTIKLADFGLSGYVPHGGKIDGICGSAPYICPEMLLTGASDLKADVWSFGVIVHLLLCGYFPYNGQDIAPKSMKEAIVSGRPVKCKQSWLSNSACEFLAAMLNRDPESRLPAEVALTMPFFMDSSQKSELPNLQQQLLRAARKCAFEQDLTPSTKVDLLLKGGTTACKVLTQSQMDAFVAASPEKMDELVQGFFLLDCTEKKAQETLSNASTCASSSITRMQPDARLELAS